MAGVAADVARADGPAQAMCTRQVKECLAVLAGLIDDPDRQAGERLSCSARVTATFRLLPRTLPIPERSAFQKPFASVGSLAATP